MTSLSLPLSPRGGGPDYRGEINPSLEKDKRYFLKETHINKCRSLRSQKDCNIQVHRLNTNLLLIYSTECLDILVRNQVVKHCHLGQVCLRLDIKFWLIFLEDFRQCFSFKLIVNPPGFSAQFTSLFHFVKEKWEWKKGLIVWIIFKRRIY